MLLYRRTLFYHFSVFNGILAESKKVVFQTQYLENLYYFECDTLYRVNQKKFASLGGYEMKSTGMLLKSYQFINQKD